MSEWYLKRAKALAYKYRLRVAFLLIIHSIIIRKARLFKVFFRVLSFIHL